MHIQAPEDADVTGTLGARSLGSSGQISLKLHTHRAFLNRIRMISMAPLGLVEPHRRSANCEPYGSGRFSCVIGPKESSLRLCFGLQPCIWIPFALLSYLWPIKAGVESTTITQFRRARVAPFINSTYTILTQHEKINDNWIEQRVPVTHLSGKSFGIFKSR